MFKFVLTVVDEGRLGVNGRPGAYRCARDVAGGDRHQVGRYWDWLFEVVDNIVGGVFLVLEQTGGEGVERRGQEVGEGGFDGRGVEAGEERSGMYWLTLGEQVRQLLAVGLLRVQPL